MFPCTMCGLCCQNISEISELKDFDLGNGVCKHFDYNTRKCLMYEKRPDICQVETMYEKLFYRYVSKEVFYMENARVCNSLQDKYKIDSAFRIKIGD